MTFRLPVLRLALLTASTLLALSGCNCGRECTVATDCPTAGQVCDQGVCKEGPDGGQQCSPACPTGQFCDTAALTCRKCDATFQSPGVNRGCFATEPICDTTANGGVGECRSCAPTSTDGGSDPGCGGAFPICDPTRNAGAGLCVTCSDRGGCGNNRVCDVAVDGGTCKTCIPSTDGGVALGCTAPEPVCVVTSPTVQTCKVCTSTAGCTGGTLCDTSANLGKGQCDYCLPSTDAGAAPGCTPGAPVCELSRDAGHGGCVTCNASAGCGTPLICDVADNGGTGRCKNCYDGSGSTDPGCSSGSPVCNTAADAGLGACVGCVTSADCTTAPNFACDTVVNRCKLCVVGPPQEGCNAGQTCDPLGNGGQGSCLGCATDQNCQLPDGGLGSTPRCIATPPPGTCVECVGNPDCTDPTRPACNVTSNTCGCTGNPDCTAAGTPICDTAANSGNGVCVVCTATQGCSGDTPFCSNDTQCICRDNSDCPVGKACTGSPASCQPVDVSGAQTGIIQFLDAGVGSVNLLIDGAYITYFKPAIGTTNSDPPGFFLQAQASGPGMYVAVDPVTVSADGGSLSVGDRVQLTVTSKYLIGSTTIGAANGINGVSVLSTNHPVQHLDTDTPAGLVVDVSGATDVVSNIPAYLSRVVKMSGFIDGGFVSSGTDHFQADFPTAGVPAIPVPRLRLPTNVLDALDLGQGCRVTLKVGPFWRFTTTAQPTSYSQGDIQVISCAFGPSVLYAYALSDTSVEVTLDHNVDPASVNAANFNIPGLVVLTAIGNGRKVVLGTTPQLAATRYTVTATGLTGVSGTPMSTTANHADFTGFGPPPGAGLVINEIDYDNPGTDNFEYLEIYNGTVNPVDLGALFVVAVNGGDSSTIAHREYQRFNLIGTVDDAGVPNNMLPAGGYFVLGRGDGGTLNLLAPVPDSALRMAFPNSDTLQNGPADGVGLLHYASGQMVDSVVYEPIATTEQTSFTIATGVGDRTFNFAEGNAPTTAADITFDAGCLARQPNGADTNNNNADFQFVIPYTPGSANP